MSKFVKQTAWFSNEVYSQEISCVIIKQGQNHSTFRFDILIKELNVLVLKQKVSREEFFRGNNWDENVHETEFDFKE